MKPLHRNFACRFVFLLFAISLPASVLAVDDPFLGDWQGDQVVAQVIPLGGDVYRVILLPEFDVRCASLVDVEVKREGNRLTLKEGDWSGWFEDGIGELRMNRGGQPRTERLRRVQRESPTLGAKPPAGAVVLFDGSGFKKWQVRGAEPDTAIAWKIVEGAMEVAPSGKQAQPKQ